MNIINYDNVKCNYHLHFNHVAHLCVKNKCHYLSFFWREFFPYHLHKNIIFAKNTKRILNIIILCILFCYESCKSVLWTVRFQYYINALHEQLAHTYTLLHRFERMNTHKIHKNITCSTTMTSTMISLFSSVCTHKFSGVRSHTGMRSVWR